MFPGSGTVLSGKVGFMGPTSAKKNPTYEEVNSSLKYCCPHHISRSYHVCLLVFVVSQVCSGETQHVEVYNLEFEGDEQTYEDLVKHFFMFHDPTTLNQQGNDRGSQYASAIFCSDRNQVPVVIHVLYSALANSYIHT